MPLFLACELRAPQVCDNTVSPQIPSTAIRPAAVPRWVLVNATTQLAPIAKNKAAPTASAFRGLQYPKTFRSSSPRLYAVHLRVCALLTLMIPRSQLRRPPPVSHTCAKVRSHRSLRQRFNLRPLSERTRRRLARNASSYSAGLSVQQRLFCRPSGT